MAVQDPRPHDRRPRGLNFLLGGAVVAAGMLGYLAVGGQIDLGGYGAPQVLIAEPGAGPLGVR